MVADGAVGAPGRSVELAGDTPLHADRNPVYVGILVQWGPQLVLSVLVGGRCKAQESMKPNFRTRGTAPPPQTHLLVLRPDP